MGALRQRTVVGMVALVALGGAALGGCGGDDEEGEVLDAAGTTGETEAGGENPSRISVSLTEFALTPENPGGKAGTIEIEATNDGDITHNLTVEGPLGEETLENDLQPGEIGTLPVDLAEPGSYRWYCPIANHAEMGMEGEIRVE